MKPRDGKKTEEGQERCRSRFVWILLNIFYTYFLICYGGFIAIYCAMESAKQENKSKLPPGKDFQEQQQLWFPPDTEPTSTALSYCPHLPQKQKFATYLKKYLSSV